MRRHPHKLFPGAKRGADFAARKQSVATWTWQEKTIVQVQAARGNSRKETLDEALA